MRQPGIMTFGALCRKLGRDRLYVRGIQQKLGLPASGRSYPEAYLLFMQKIIALRTASVPLAEIGELLETEKKILQILHVDSLSGSETWYLDACAGRQARTGHSLLLTGADAGFDVSSGQVQDALDFGSRAAELFTGAEMGEDLQRLLARYTRLRSAVIARLNTEKPVLEQSLKWIKRIAGKS